MDSFQHLHHCPPALPRFEVRNFLLRHLYVAISVHSNIIYAFLESSSFNFQQRLSRVVRAINQILFHHRLLTNRVWNSHLIITNDDPEIMRQCPEDICVKLVSVLEDKSEDSLRHVNCIFVHISHNSLYYKCFSGYGKLYFLT